MSLFGKGQSSGEGLSVKAGINSGFQAKSFFEIQNGTRTDGSTWKAIVFEFDGAISPRDMLFVPTKQTKMSEWDTATGIVKHNERRAKKSLPEDTAEAYMKHKYIKDLQDFDRQLRMYAFTFYADGSAERKAADDTLPSYDTPEEFIADIDNYVKKLAALLPENYTGMSYDIILGKKSGGQYLEFPDKIWRTGRYVKLTGDDSRELSLSDSFKTKYMSGATEEDKPAPKAASSISWG